MSNRTWSNFLNLIQVWKSDTDVAVKAIIERGAGGATFGNKIELQRAPGVTGTAVGDVNKIDAIEKSFQIIFPAGATGTITIEGSADGVNFRELASEITSALYVNQQPISYWRSTITDLVGAPGLVSTSITISEITVDADKIANIEGEGKFWEFSGTGIGTASTVGDYMQLTDFQAGQFKDDWNNQPFPIYEVVDADTIRIFDDTGKVRTTVGEAELMSFLAFVIASS